jgi:hypothetical protein
MKLDQVSAPLQHHRLHIVVENFSRDASPISESVNVGQKQGFEHLVEKELKPKRPAERESHNKAREAAAGAANGNLAEVGPVGLPLLTGQRLEAEEGFPAAWAQSGNHAAQPDYAALVAPLANHLVYPSGAQARVSLKSLLDEIDIGFNQFPAARGSEFEPIGVERATDSVGMQSEFGCDCSDFPVLGVEQAADCCD